VAKNKITDDFASPNAEVSFMFLNKKEFDKELTGVGYKGLRSRVGLRGYRAINTLALVSIALGLVGVTTFFVWQFVFLSLLAAGLGTWALLSYLNSPEEVTGYYLAVSGIVISLVIGTAGAGWFAWNYYHSVPKGYLVVDFADMALDKTTRKLPENIVALGRERKKVFIKGYMYQGGQQRSNLRNFMMVRTVEHCKFCSPHTNPTDMIEVVLANDMKINLRTTPIRVGGTLYVNENFAYGELPYFIVADVIK